LGERDVDRDGWGNVVGSLLVVEICLPDVEEGLPFSNITSFLPGSLSAEDSELLLQLLWQLFGFLCQQPHEGNTIKQSKLNSSNVYCSLSHCISFTD
jgi:hypothetical protein